MQSCNLVEQKKIMIIIIIIKGNYQSILEFKEIQTCSHFFQLLCFIFLLNSFEASVSGDMQMQMMDSLILWGPGQIANEIKESKPQSATQCTCHTCDKYLSYWVAQVAVYTHTTTIAFCLFSSLLEYALRLAVPASSCPTAPPFSQWGKYRL